MIERSAADRDVDNHDELLALLLTSQRAPVTLPVGSHAVPPWSRRRMLQIYAFAAVVRAIADSDLRDAGLPDNEVASRSGLLDALEADIVRLRGLRRPHQLVIRKAGRASRHGDRALTDMHHLIAAARQDLLDVRYGTYEDLLGYCDLSGASLGRLIMAALTRRQLTSSLSESVDTIYQAARLLSLCHHIGEDAARGRSYLPQADLRALSTGPVLAGTNHATHRQRDVIQTQVWRARYALQAARPILPRLPPILRIAVTGVYAEAVTAARSLERERYDPLIAIPISRLARGRCFTGALLSRPL